MANLVLVHGAMHGGWVWSRVRPLLEARGHRITTPTLTGLGERRHLLSRDTCIATHVEDLSAHLELDRIEDATLVVHSYAGVVGDALAETDERIAGIVRLDAFLVDDGECLMDVQPETTRAFYERWAAERGDGWRLVPDAAFLAQWSVVDEDAVAFVAPRLTDFPLRCTTDRVSLPRRRGRARTLGVVWHESPALGGLATSRLRADAMGWPVERVAAGHDAMVSRPHDVADAIHALVLKGPP